MVPGWVCEEKGGKAWVEQGCIARFGFVHVFTVDLDPVDVQETTFQASAWGAFFRTGGVGERASAAIADAEGHGDLLARRFG